jgi:hypothetical protein
MSQRRSHSTSRVSVTKRTFSQVIRPMMGIKAALSPLPQPTVAALNAG